MDQTYDMQAQASSGSAIGGIIGLIIYLGILAFFIATAWKIFTKAGQPGWAAIVPIYNMYVMTQIVGRPAWWIALIFVPIAGPVVWYILMPIDLAKSFGKSTGFGVGLIFLGFIFAPILAFGSAQYVGPAAAQGAAPARA